MLRNQKGISLVQVMISAALLGLLSILFMKLVDNMQVAQNQATSKADEIELQQSIRMILDNDRFCRVSFAGNGPTGSPLSPVTFKKKDIDNLNDEGLDVSLYLSDAAGETRTIKKFNGADNPGPNPNNDKSKFGKLTIKSMKLVLNNPTGAGVNYPNNPDHSDMGVLRVIVEKKVTASQKREITMDFDLTLRMSTGQPPEANKETRILSCETSNAPPPSPVTMQAGRFPYACTSAGGTFVVNFPDPFDNPPVVLFTPQWARYSGDEDTTWWITEVTTTSFRASYWGPNSGGCVGESFVFWTAIDNN